MFRKILRRYGILTTISGLTLISILLSIGITLAVNSLLEGGALRDGLAIAILAPTLIAPTMSLQMLRLLSQLDQTEEKLRALSHTDELTKTYNRRYFMQFGEQQLGRAQRYQEPFSIALLDLDNFKQVNDQCGHLMGDRVLRELAALLRGEIRQTDVFARYGGDEFIFLFPQTNKLQTKLWADRILERFAGTSISLEGLEVQPSFSIGIAEFDSTVNNLDDLLKQADFALYQAKKRGGQF